MSIIPNLIRRFIIMPIKSPSRVFISIDKVTLNFTEKSKQIWRTNTMLKKKNKVGGISLPNVKTSSYSHLWFWQKHRLIDQWSKTENSEINLYKYAQLVFDKGAKSNSVRKDSFFTEWRWNIWTYKHLNHQQKTKQNKTNSKWITDLNAKHKTIGENQQDPGLWAKIS